MTDKLTDLRGKFFVVEDAAVTDYDLTPYEGWLYIVMLKHANRTTGELFPSIKTLVKETRMSKAQVLRCTKTLEAKGLIRVTRDEQKNGKDRAVNHYFILSATQYLPDTTPGIYQTPPPVSNRNLNQSQLEPENTLSSDDDAVEIASDKTTAPKDVVPAAEMNPMKDAIAAAFGYDWKTMTKTEKGLTQKTARELCLADVKPEQVAALYRYCAARFTTFKPGALSGNVSDWRKTVQPQSSNSKGDKNSPDYDPRYDLDIPVEFDPWDNFFKPEYE